MKRYEVRIDLQSRLYSVTAGSQEEAIERAKDLAYEEKLYDLLKWAEYGVKEIGEAEE